MIRVSVGHVAAFPVTAQRQLVGGAPAPAQPNPNPPLPTNWEAEAKPICGPKTNCTCTSSCSCSRPGIPGSRVWARPSGWTLLWSRVAYRPALSAVAGAWPGSAKTLLASRAIWLLVSSS